ncbi:unnamed protein product [Penicillium salamii]|uniref:Spo12 n=2 Tax=Penicillium salamii TaxID=1612424 RepID=A0A9W4NR18_9EURO|nr:unnamed protein product [Penicillium salamii]CAG8211175.1 unnamed protein product [Penicillium salamii]CAG8226043.1 unnamed protein product [Penicillium salamii]CAG8231849.1 unnamed protein product [Penicillium salamii]CAG8244910.1 unnamed protein product [Penicillium salamii]
MCCVASYTTLPGQQSNPIFPTRFSSYPIDTVFKILHIRSLRFISTSTHPPYTNNQKYTNPKMDATTQAQPLADRSTNTHLGDKTDLKGDISSMEYHRQVLQEKVAGEEQPTSYVSPSDELMSPCTKKLSDIKGKRFKNAGKPQSLFAKLGKKSYEQSSAEKGRED